MSYATTCVAAFCVATQARHSNQRLAAAWGNTSWCGCTGVVDFVLAACCVSFVAHESSRDHLALQEITDTEQFKCEISCLSALLCLLGMLVAHMRRGYVSRALARAPVRVANMACPRDDEWVRVANMDARVGAELLTWTQPPSRQRPLVRDEQEMPTSCWYELVGSVRLNAV